MFIRGAIGAVALVAIAGTSHAAIINSGGDVSVIAAPASSALGDLESTTLAWAFNEATNFTLTANLSVDATTPGVYTSNGSLTPGVIPSGTTVNSHYLYSDPVGSVLGNYEGFVEFDAPILGVIVLRPGLNLSDILGAPGTNYADNSARGMELSSNESFTITITQQRVNFRFNTTSATDDIRIITAVPTPGAAGLLGLGGLAMLRRKRA